MITGYETNRPILTEPIRNMQWSKAVGAGLIAGAVLLITPRGSPWSSLTFFSPAIMGRTLPVGVEAPLMLVWLVHLMVSIVYGLIISRVVASFTQGRAVLTGGILGLALYVLNLGVVSLLRPDMRGNETSVIFSHIVFGLVAAGAYRGLLRRRVA